MSKVLLILTDRYPYGTGETFIENERKFWDSFDHVFLCPVLLSAGDTLRKDFVCRENETLITTTREQYKKSDIMKTLLPHSWGKRIVSEIVNTGSRVRRCSRNKTILGYAVRSHQRARLIGDELTKYISSADDIAVYSYWFLEPALVGIELAERYGSKSMFSRAHRYDLYEERHTNSFLPYRNLLLNSYTRVCPISTDGRNYIIDHYGNTYAQKTFVERLGTIRYYPLNDDVREGRDREITIVSCSAISAVKRVHLIADALKQTKRNIHWIHFGDGALRSELNQAVRSIPSNVNVEIMGFVENRDIQKYYSEHAIDAFINVSSSEGVPVSIMEAQSYGIPVIATDVGGTAELVHDRENGVLLRPDFSSEELLSALDLVLANSHRYRAGALQTWESMSNADRIYRDFFDIALNEMS